VVRKPGEEFAEAILAWLTDGKPAPTAADYRAQALSDKATHLGMRALYEDAKARNLLGAAVLDAEGHSTTLGDLIVSRGKALEASHATN
jgi:hypothetical protein